MDKINHSDFKTTDTNDINADRYMKTIHDLEVILQRLRDYEISPETARHEISKLDPDWEVIMRKFDEPLSFDQVENLIQEEVYRLEEARRAVLPGTY